MIYYEPAKVTIDTLGLIKIIINIEISHYDLFNSNISNRNSVFISKFWLWLYYFLRIKKSLSTIFNL